MKQALIFLLTAPSLGAQSNNLEFLNGSHMVFQLLLAKTRDAVPIRRDFMFDTERSSRVA